MPSETPRRRETADDFRDVQPRTSSRRQLLTAAGVAAAATVAGCLSGEDSESSSSNDVDACSTWATNHGDGSLLNQGAHVEVDDENVVLVIPLQRDRIEQSGAAYVEAYRRGRDSSAFAIPVRAEHEPNAPQGKYPDSGIIEYEQSLGPRPQNGVYRLDGVTSDGTVVDTVTVEFNCARRRENGNETARIDPGETDPHS
ncbi:hypothetical protein AUR64_15720 [Haloprofundus marisrubri]|uniref:Uncharacterized protein n=1 Tax=Haloprofundus marisrubri TaxID=1514971 RepID=A0A0W1R8X2_9EURY|nr:hypothetical protein [Haloprofundus marisrubri]KTG09237.1 hypothetical protein AUR64_15720 [Haloprofundus marisrubri]